MARFKTIDWPLIIIPLVLVSLSIATIYTITYVTVGGRLALSQLVFALAGLGLGFTAAVFDYRHLRGLAWVLFGIGMVLLIPMLPMFSSKVPMVICEFNACRWLDLGFFRFQTSEMMKLVVPVFLAALLADRIGRMPWWHLFIYLGIIGIPFTLIMQQPDLGTAMVVFFTGVSILLVSRFPVWLWVGLCVVALASAPLAWQQLKPYQKRRIEVFLNPDLDPNSTGYNVRQAEIAVGNGGLLGRGFGQGSQGQLNFLPVAHTDFIFAGYAEATGFVGSVFLVLLFLFLLWRAIRVAELSKDRFGRLLAIGLAGMLASHVAINIGMNIRLAPVTGVPLPLVSYGGTSMFITMIALGMLQSIVIRHKKISFS